MSANYREMTLHDLRLVLLCTLARASAYTSNAYLLGRSLEAAGHHESSDTLRAQLYWLAEQDLLRLVDEPPMLVASLTQRGLDVALGRATVPGVQRPAPV